MDPDSYLRIDRIEATGSATIWFPAVSNKTYTVQFSDQPAGSPWIKLADVVAQPTNHLAVVNDPTSTPHRYYRLVTPRQP